MTISRLRAYRPALAIALLPSLLLIGIFSYYPAVRSLIGGFYAWNGFSPPTSSPSTSRHRRLDPS
jgi:ABC-type sugar transport system permease subunit